MLVAISLTVLLGIAALAIDTGNFRAHRRQLQSAADAGALAGAAQLIVNPGAVCGAGGRADYYERRNSDLTDSHNLIKNANLDTSYCEIDQQLGAREAGGERRAVRVRQGAGLPQHRHRGPCAGAHRLPDHRPRDDADRRRGSPSADRPGDPRRHRRGRRVADVRVRQQPRGIPLLLRRRHGQQPPGGRRTRARPGDGRHRHGDRLRQRRQRQSDRGRLDRHGGRAQVGRHVVRVHGQGGLRHPGHRRSRRCTTRSRRPRAASASTCT